jgi:hypothetical protein
MGNAAAYRYAEIYAQWGKAAGALLDPLRKEPRFQTIERELKFSG